MFMEKLLRFLSSCLLTSLLTFPAVTNSMTTDGMDAMDASGEAVESEAIASAEDSLVLSIQHTIDSGKPLSPRKVLIPWSDVEDNPLLIIQSLMDNVLEQLPQDAVQPIKVHTEVTVELEEGIANVLGELPKLTINTQRDKQQNVTSDFTYPAYRRDVPKEYEAGTIDWKGVTGQVAYTKASQSLKIGMDTKGLAVSKDKDFKFELGKVALNMMLGADLLPTQIDFTFAGFDAKDLTGEGDFNIKDVALKMDTKQSSLGVRLSDGSLTLKQINYAEGKEKLSLEGLQFTTSSNEEGEVVHFSLNSALQKLSLPALPQLGKAFSLSNYTGNLAFRNVDEKSLLALQQSMQQFTSQGIVNLSEETAGMAMFALMGTLMQIIPDVISKSPEIALTQFNMTTSEGNLDANGAIRIDGSQVKTLDESAIIPAIQAQAKLLIARQLLKTMFMMDNPSADKSDKTISTIQKEGWLVAEDKDLKSEVSMANGKLTVNGKVMFDYLAEKKRAQEAREKMRGTDEGEKGEESSEEVEKE